MAESAYEKKYGVKTAGMKRNGSVQFYHYQGAGYWVLLKILPQFFEQTQTFTFFDIGCGKGRAVFVAESCGYKKLVGIDLDEELVLKANENLKIYKRRRDTNIEFLKSNALDYDYKNEPTVYFLFNPFNEHILKKVVEKIVSATKSETYFIYMNPKHAKAFNNECFQLVSKIKTKLYVEAMIFRIRKEYLSL